MKNLRIYLCAFLASALASSLAAAGFIKFDGVEGESQDEDHKGWSDVISVSGLPAAKDAGSGLPTGKRIHKPIAIVKPIDKATPLLAQARSGGSATESLGTVRISQDGVEYELTEVKVVKVERSGDQETLTLSFGAIRMVRDTANTAISNAPAVKAQDHNASRSNKR